jgi:tripartite-type tricarboxylate transporter receptor subunit TctC
MDTWFGLVGPAKLPEPIVSRLIEASQAVVREPAFHDKLISIGCDTAWMPPAELRRFIAAESERWERLIPAMGIALAD